LSGFAVHTPFTILCFSLLFFAFLCFPSRQFAPSRLRVRLLPLLSFATIRAFAPSRAPFAFAFLRDNSRLRAFARDSPFTLAVLLPFKNYKTHSTSYRFFFKNSRNASAISL